MAEPAMFVTRQVYLFGVYTGGIGVYRCIQGVYRCVRCVRCTHGVYMCIQGACRVTIGKYTVITVLEYIKGPLIWVLCLLFTHHFDHFVYVPFEDPP